MSILTSVSSQVRTKPARTAFISIITLAVIGAGAFGIFWFLRDDSQVSAQSETQVEFQVERGDIVTSVSLGGTSEFSTREDVSFDANGTVEDVMVSAGDQVEEGDVIATLNAATVAALRVALSNAEDAQNDAQAVYDKAASGATSRVEIAEAEEALAKAQLDVTAAEKALNEVSAAEGVDAVAIAEAREAVAFAERELSAAERTLEDAEQSVIDAEVSDELNTAIDDYRDVLLRWLGAVPDGFEEMELDEILDLWATSLSEIYTTEADLHADSETPWSDDESTPWNDVVVWTWTRMSATVIDTERTTPSSSGIMTPRVEINDAWDALESARADKADEQEATEAALLAAEQTVVRERNDLESAQDALTELLDPVLLQARQAALDAATARRDEAEIGLAMARSGAEAKVESAQSKLDLAQQNYDDAVEALESATLVSPISGTVLTVNIDPGDSVTPATVVAEIADTTVIAVESSVDEEDILSIQVGLPVRVTLDAVPGQVFTGIVAAVGQAQQGQQGAVTFPVTITLDDTGGMELVEGLTASAQVINSQVNDVLMVPVAAVGGTLFEPSVEVMTPGGSEQVPVQLGSSNGTFVEIVSGVEEGATVLATIAGEVGLAGNGGFFIPGGGGGSTTITIPAGGFGGGGGRAGTIRGN